MTRSMLCFAQTAILATCVLLGTASPSQAQRRGGGFVPFFPYVPWGGYGPFGAVPNYSWNPYFGSYPSYYYPSTYSSPSYTYYYSQPTLIVVQPVIAPQPTSSSDSLYQGEPENAAKIEVQLPAGADLWFDGKKTKQTGGIRNFATPPLMPGQVYNYDIRATWKDDSGATVTRTRTVDLQAGQKLSINLNLPDDQ